MGLFEQELRRGWIPPRSSDRARRILSPRNPSLQLYTYSNRRVGTPAKRQDDLNLLTSTSIVCAIPSTDVNPFDQTETDAAKFSGTNGDRGKKHFPCSAEHDQD